MLSSNVLAIIFFTFCAAPAPADAFFWKRHTESEQPALLPHFKRQESGTLYNFTAPNTNYTISSVNSSRIAPVVSNFTSTTSNFTFSPPAIEAGIIQGAVVTATVPLYAICGVSGSGSTTSCATIRSTITTSACSTTITAGFNRYSISDCNQNITFSSHNSYSIATAPPSTTTASSLSPEEDSCLSPAPSTYIRTITTYHVCPWRSLVSGDPKQVTVVTCTTDDHGQAACDEVFEVWAIYTKLVQITTSTIVSINQFFQYPAVMYLGGGQSLSVDSGHVDLRTSIIYTTSAISYETSTSQQASALSSSSLAVQTSTPTLTTTVSTTSTSTSTETETSTLSGNSTALNFTISNNEPTTTYTSYTTFTSTTTVF